MEQELYVALLLLCFGRPVPSYDEYSSCSRPLRGSRGRLEPPCDFRHQTWCTIPGSAYPWHAVRRFVYENQGLMRRMYGEVRQITVLRAEFESNEITESEERESNSVHDINLYTTAKPSTRTSATPPMKSTTSTVATSKTSTTSTTTNPTTTNIPTTTDPPTTFWESTTMVEDYPEEESTLESTTMGEVYQEKLFQDALEEDEPEEAREEELVEVDDMQVEETIDEEEVEEDKTELNKPVYQAFKLRGVNACPVKEEVVAPFWANNTRGEVLALLNLYPFEQYVHWEKCTYEHKQMFCRDGCRCEQQYRLHRLLAYDPKNECRGIFSDWFKFPSCCVCKCYDIPSDFRLTSRSPRVPTHVKTITKQPPIRKSFPLPQPETSTIGTVDAATPHFFYNNFLPNWYRLSNGSLPLSRSPREV